jgi:nucleoside-diphosphate-sugar epimerase
MILITGAGGFLGTAIRQILDARGAPYLQVRGRRDTDLRDTTDTHYCIASAVQDDGVETVIHLAYPGTEGIGTMLAQPAELTADTLQMDLNVIRSCAAAKVRKLITIGSVCSYPEQVSLPTDESQLLLGAPEKTNAPYGHAKRMQLALLDAYQRQWGLQYTQLLLTNLYGPGDRSGHVIPATIRKVLAAQASGAQFIPVWGDGRATREFLYVQDAAEAVLQAAGTAALNDCVNICSGHEVSIAALVQGVMQLLDYPCTVIWDPTKPNGQPRRLFDATRARRKLGWTPTTPFTHGLSRTVDAMRSDADHE